MFRGRRLSRIVYVCIHLAIDTNIYSIKLRIVHLFREFKIIILFGLLSISFFRSLFDRCSTHEFTFSKQECRCVRVCVCEQYGRWLHTLLIYKFRVEIFYAYSYISNSETTLKHLSLSLSQLHFVWSYIKNAKIFIYFLIFKRPIQIFRFHWEKCVFRSVLY